MESNEVSIGQVKRDISELVNRVAYGHERIILTSRGKPKAALIGMDDLEKLTTLLAKDDLTRWHSWQADCNALGQEILARRQGEPLDIDRLWTAAKAEQEARDDQRINN